MSRVTRTLTRKPVVARSIAARFSSGVIKVGGRINAATSSGLSV